MLKLLLLALRAPSLAWTDCVDMLVCRNLARKLSVRPHINIVIPEQRAPLLGVRSASGKR